MENQRRNLLLITCDALRPDYLGCYGNEKNISPHIDQFAEKAVLFEKAYSTGPNTFSSFPSLLTGCYPQCYKDVSYGDLLEKRPPLPEILLNRGYKTGAFHSNPYLSQIFGYDRGFDVFFDSFSEEVNKSPTTLSNAIGTKLLRALHSETLFSPLIRFFNRAIGLLKRFENWTHDLMDVEVIEAHLGYTRATEITDKAQEFIQAHTKSGPFFLWLHYMDPHTPLMPPSKYVKDIYGIEIEKEESLALYRKQVSKRCTLSEQEIQKLKMLYSAEIKYLDEEIGRLFDYLRDNSLTNNSTIALTADHGEEFNEHGDFLHKEKLYDELLHVPLIIRDPTLSRKRIRTSVSLVDLVPTLSHLLQVQVEDEQSVINQSLLPLIQGKSKKRSKIISLVAQTKMLQTPSKSLKIALREGNWKIIHNKGGRDELYNLKDDPQEKKNLIKREKRVARKMLKTLRDQFSARSGGVTKREVRKRISNLKNKPTLKLD